MLGLAYPILLQVIARLDERYESEYIAALFKTEFQWKFFRYTLVVSLVSVFVWALPPIVEVDGFNFFIGQSAQSLLIIMAILLVISFFSFVKKVLQYYTLSDLIPYLIQKHRKSNTDDLRCFQALSDLLYLTIRKQQTNPSRTLSDFFYTAFRDVRNLFNNAQVVYPDIYYETVSRAVEELAILKEKRNYLLEHRTSGGIWLLGETQGKEISDKTYSYLWRNLLLAIRYQQDDLIVRHWETCDQYYFLYMPEIYPERNNSTDIFQVSNQSTVDKRTEEREQFIEFHYALGGLLTYKEKYACIRRLFVYTQSEPPDYELLPTSMNEIFDFFIKVRDPFNNKYSWISHQYPFPELSGLGADKTIKKWIMSYMAILFLRQYSIIPHLSIIRPLDFPDIPLTQGEINDWIYGVDFMKKLVSGHLSNEDLLKTLKLDFLTRDWCVQNQKLYPTDYIDTFITQLKEKYHSNALTLSVSAEKRNLFKTKSKYIIESEIEKLKQINNPVIIDNNNSDKWYVHGSSLIQGKDAFSESPEVHHSNFDSFLATIIVKTHKDGLGNSFLIKTSKSYLIKTEDIFKAVDNLGIDDKYVIINFGVHLDFFINSIKVDGLTPDSYRNTIIYTFQGSHSVNDSMFILKKSDLPNITSKQIAENLIEKYSLEKISETTDLQYSIIDLNDTSDDIYNESIQNKSEDEVRKSVLTSLYVTTEIKWKKNAEVIQLRQHSEFFQKGIANKLSDVKSLSKEELG